MSGPASLKHITWTVEIYKWMRLRVSCVITRYCMGHSQVTSDIEYIQP